MSLQSQDPDHPEGRAARAMFLGSETKEAAAADPADSMTCESVEFPKWLHNLRRISKLPDSGFTPFDGAEGDGCWLAYFESGDTPRDALRHDLEHAD